MTDINSVVLIGRLTRDCEAKEIGNSVKVNFSIAVDRQWNQESFTSFFDVQMWGALANALKTYLKKGTKVAVTGSLVQNRYETQSGEKRSKVYIEANSINLLSSKKEENDMYSKVVNMDIDDMPPF